MAWHLLGAKPLPEPMLTYLSIGDMGKYLASFNQNTLIFIHENVFQNIVCCKVVAIWSRPQYVEGIQYFKHTSVALLVSLC